MTNSILSRPRTTFVCIACFLLPACFEGNPDLPAESGSSTSTSANPLYTTDVLDDGTTGETGGPTGSTGGVTTIEPHSSTGSMTSGTSSTDETTTAAASSSGETQSECRPDSVCLSSPPPPWSGPVRLADGSDSAPPPPCPTGSQTAELDLHFGLSAAPAECDCTCGSAQGVECGSTTLEFHGSDAGCAAPDASFPISYAGSGGTCVAGPNGMPNSYWRAEPLGVAGGSCSPNAEEAVPEAAWDGESNVCDIDVSSLRTCEFDGVCAPSAATDDFPAGHCVWREGEHTCEGLGQYTERELRWTGVDDDRGCSECSCDAPEGQCAGEVWLYSGGSCSGPLERIDTDGGCYALDIDVDSAILRESAAGCGGPCQVVVSASCAALGGDAQGEATPVSPYTFCCTG